MNDFMTIIAKLKTLLSQTKRQTVHDRDVALALGLAPSTFAAMKRRQTIPYRAILDYCVRNHINANALLLCRPVNNLIAGPESISYENPLNADRGKRADQTHFNARDVRQFLPLSLPHPDTSASFSF